MKSPGRFAFALVGGLLFVGLGASACERTPASSGASASGTGPAAWKCFARDPAQPALPQGDVTHTRQRLIDGRLEVESVHAQAGRGGATRLAFQPASQPDGQPAGQPAGNLLAATFGGVAMEVRLVVPDGSHWILSYKDPTSGLEFSEENQLTGAGLTVTSIDPGEAGPIKTAVRFVPTACANVVAELANFPG